MKIIRSNRKTLSLRLTPEGEPEVRAPLRCTDAEILRFVEKHRRWLDRRAAALSALPPRTPEYLARLRAAAKELLPRRAAYYAALMGVRPAGIRITAAKTRYGSCSPENRICFSLFLMEKPPRAIDYVVVHELAHIRHHDHSPAFYREIEKILPDYRERIKELKYDF